MYIIHLFHSGFLIENQGNYFVFDPISTFTIPENYKHLFVLASHSHDDHFKPEVFKHYYQEEKAQFIFSRDIEDKIDKEDICNLHIVDPYENMVIDDIRIESYGSTDKGNSYLVHANEKSYFHSGDLNWWHWNRMNGEELKVEEMDYKKEINLLQGKAIDYAFIPVDPRLGEHAYLTINHFIEVVKPKVVIPMHAFGRYDFYEDLQSHVDLKDTALIRVEGENERLV